MGFRERFCDGLVKQRTCFKIALKKKRHAGENRGKGYFSQVFDGYPHLLKSISLEGVPGSPQTSQKEGQED